MQGLMPFTKIQIHSLEENVTMGFAQGVLGVSEISNIFGFTNKRAVKGHEKCSTCFKMQYYGCTIIYFKKYELLHVNSSAISLQLYKSNLDHILFGKTNFSTSKVDQIICIIN